MIASPILNKNSKNFDSATKEAEFRNPDVKKIEIQTESQINTVRIGSIHLKGNENPDSDEGEFNKKIK